MILIVSQPEDPRGRVAARNLERRREPHAFFTPARFPQAITVSYRFDGGAATATITCDGRQIDLAQVRSIYHVRSSRPEPHQAVTDPQVRRFVADECAAALHDMYLALDCFWVPGPPALLSNAQYKGLGLRLAVDEGLAVPRTLVTSDPTAARDFYLACGGSMIRKQVGPYQIQSHFPDRARYTDVVSPRDIAYLSSLRYCPITLQEYVPKRFEVRATVVGDQVFAASIDSQASNRSRYDWRRYDHGNTRYAIHRLPEEVARACVAVVRRIGLNYGAIDLIVKPDGGYVFLEVNPVGEYLWIESRTGLKITDAISDLLVSGRPVREPRQLECA